MFKRMTLAILVVALGLVPVRAQEKPALVVHAFTIASGVKCPYDMNQLQAEAITALKAKDGAQFDVVSGASPNQPGVYILDGEVLEWHKGNTAERMLIAAGSVAGRESAKIDYWLTDKDGKRVVGIRTRSGDSSCGTDTKRTSGHSRDRSPIKPPSA